MLDLQRLQAEFSDFTAYQSTEQRRRLALLEQACAALADCNDDWAGLRERLRARKPQRLVADLREAPAETYAAPPRPTPITVVASDGSQVFPDRHVEPSCYLLNVSKIAFHYGTSERPMMEAVPSFRYRRDQLDGHFDVLLESATAEVVSALRDELELQALLDTAAEVHKPGRPLVAIADGTLIRWMLRRMQNRQLEDELIRRYTAILTRFQEARLPLCSYISMPGNTELINLLACFLCERDAEATEEMFEGLVDRWLFAETLPPGARSALYESSSHIQKEYGVDNRICYFYVHIPAPGGGEIGRVEMPHWVADDPALVDRLHAVVLSECEKGGGYPMILSEAHERAVIRGHERELFYQMIERQMQREGLVHTGSRKAASKRRPRV